MRLEVDGDGGSWYVPRRRDERPVAFFASATGRLIPRRETGGAMHEDGYCDRCGCEVDEPQLTVEGLAICAECAASTQRPLAHAARFPEARDDGR
jgi:hypothetical protein